MIQIAKQSTIKRLQDLKCLNKKQNLFPEVREALFTFVEKINKQQ